MLQMLECCKENNLVFMNEIGLDPGIDHSAKVIDEIREKEVRCFYLSLLWWSSC
jgi:saccharopine dehydrogenase-like NADP-dependent oxidoreductase